MGGRRLRDRDRDDDKLAGRACDYELLFRNTLSQFDRNSCGWHLADFRGSKGTTASKAAIAQFAEPTEPVVATGRIGSDVFGSSKW
ncbi:hypothetical protein ABZP36_018368 [Zizania latifolia]